MYFKLIDRDIRSILDHKEIIQNFDQSRLAILGGTGFIGKWIIASLNEICSNFNVEINVVIFTRNKEMASKLFQNLHGVKLKYEQIDFRHTTQELGNFDYFINGATPSLIATGLNDQNGVKSSSINSSKSILKSAKKFKNVPKVINLSSGIVYGPQRLDVKNQPEGNAIRVKESQSGYMNAKIESENIIELGNKSNILKSISPRLYTFFGPGIALNEHFAIGNFMHNAIKNEKILITGHPNTLRSYMYPTDLIVWLLKALLNPKKIHANVGSEDPIEIVKLAQIISELTTQKGYKVIKNEKMISNYVPSTTNFKSNYKVLNSIDLEEGLDRWLEWLRNSYS